MIHRPCLSCGSENASSATACGRCGHALSAWAERLPSASPSRAIRRLPSRRALLGLGLALALAVAVGPSSWAWLTQRGLVPAGPTWRDPASIAGWADAELQAARVEPVQVEARLESRTLAPRRLVITAHSTGPTLLDVMRAAGRFLVKARKGGEATATHLAIVRQGTRVLLLPIGDAARVAGSDEAAAAWLDQQERLRQAAADEAEVDPAILMGPEWPPPPSSGIFVGPLERPVGGGIGMEPAPLVAATGPRHPRADHARSG